MVRSKGLEPPHRCRYMDLNHARLPIPPRWQVSLTWQRRPPRRRIGRTTPSFYRRDAVCQTARTPEAVVVYSSFALIVIFAFNTFDTGHPFSAASAYF